LLPSPLLCIDACVDTTIFELPSFLFRHRIEAPPRRTYEELLAKFHEEKQARNRAEPVSAASKALPEHYPSSRQDLVPLRCRTDVFEEATEVRVPLLLFLSPVPVLPRSQAWKI
jgi:hypothetical protein